MEENNFAAYEPAYESTRASYVAYVPLFASTGTFHVWPVRHVDHPGRGGGLNSLNRPMTNTKRSGAASNPLHLYSVNCSY